MEKMVRFIGIIVFITLIGFAIAACDNEGDGGGSGGTGGVSSVELTLNNWSNQRTIASNGVHWFRFTATNETQYIHVECGTLTGSILGGAAYAQLYRDMDTPLVGSTRWYWYSGNQTILTSNYAVSSGTVYYIKVDGFGRNGTYRMSITETPSPPNN